jgi:hypothetical protein
LLVGSVLVLALLVASYFLIGQIAGPRGVP